MTAPALTLRYLFAAEFLDGSRLEQTPEDVSSANAKRSAFYDLCQRNEYGDVLQDEAGLALVRDDIAYFGITDGERFFVVDLRDGHFEVNGIWFRPEPVAHPEIPAGGRYRLLYFRDHQQDIIVAGDGSKSLGEHRMAYRMGWEYSLPDGRKWQQTIVVE